MRGRFIIPYYFLQYIIYYSPSSCAHSASVCSAALLKGGDMTVNNLAVAGTAIDFYTYGNGVCIECGYSGDTGSLYIANGSFYSEVGDTVRVDSGTLTIGEATFTKDVSSNQPNIPSQSQLSSYTREQFDGLYATNNSAVNILGGALTIGNATFNITGSGVTAITASGAGASVTADTANFTFSGSGSGTPDSSFTRAIYADGAEVVLNNSADIMMARADDGQSLTSRYNVGVLVTSGGTVNFNGTSAITINGNANPSGGNYGIYSTGGHVTCGTDGNSSTTIKIAASSASTQNYGIYSQSGAITTYGTTTIELGNSENNNLSRYNYGIYSGGGNITCGSGGGTTNITVYGTTGTVTYNNQDLTSEHNYGIFSAGGLTEVYGSATISLNGINSTGVLSYVEVNDAATADNGVKSGTINIKGTYFECTIAMGTDTVLSSTAVSTINGAIAFGAQQVEIESNGLGLTSQNGDITFEPYTDSTESAAASTVNLKTTRGTAIYVSRGGNLKIDQNVTLAVESAIASGTSWAPDQDGATNTGVNIYNGIYVRGGSLTSQGTLNVTHAGVANDDYSSYDQLEIKSYAVRVEAAADNVSLNSTTVTITGGTITNSVGGGLHVSGDAITDSNGATTGYSASVTLGTADGSSPTVSATGTTYGDLVTNSQSSNWGFYKNQTGGHAVEVDGGSLTINGGSYSTAFGNGIYVTGGSATINSGTFTGSSAYAAGTNVGAGPAAYYGFKTLDSGSTTINNGTFSGANGGAFVMGSASTVYVTVLNGTFTTNANNAFTIFEKADVTFGKSDKTGDISVTGNACGIAINGVTKSSATGSTITIYAGTYTANNTDSDAIWYNNGYTKLDIYGGSYNGKKYGLRSAAAPQTYTDGNRYIRVYSNSTATNYITSSNVSNTGHVSFI